MMRQYLSLVAYRGRLLDRQAILEDMQFPGAKDIIRRMETLNTYEKVKKEHGYRCPATEGHSWNGIDCPACPKPQHPILTKITQLVRSLLDGEL